MDNMLPPKFLERLKLILPAEHYVNVLNTLAGPRSYWIRVNTLKSNVSDVAQILKTADIKYQTVPYFPSALLIVKSENNSMIIDNLIAQGILYPQNISSMLPAIILNPQPEENILDTCAAPGSKTSQMSAMMNNQGTIRAIDAVPKRLFKLRSVMQLLGVTNVTSTCCDFRRFVSTGQMFDKILVDAPCSSEGRFSAHDTDSYAYWSERKIKEMVQKQRGILLSASRLLSQNGILIYSTCTFAPDENEGVIDWFLRKTKLPFEVVPVSLPNEVPTYPAITQWSKKPYAEETAKCLRVLPDGSYEGFFMAVLKHKI
ncbi:MAG: RsmB/NOP family class I SAM-dependent RNA methyltransferase [Candidatus Omnitrophica bacterium]|nr:RsmB/NOP family class I SAM-dependent RNA methyltransferase [Candidatus Omnitrophota bacterium]